MTRMNQMSVRLVLMLLCACSAWNARSQEFPSKTIRLVVPYLVGSGPDIIARLIGERMAPLFGKAVVTDNRPGGGGVTAVVDLMNNPPDGHTVFVGETGHWGILPTLQPDVPYDPVRDFAPIGMVFSSFQFIVVSDALQVRDLKEFIALARARPGELRYGATAAGTIMPLIFEAFKADLGLKIEHVPYKGSGDAVQALLRGDVPVIISGLPTVIAHVRAGKLKLLAIATRNRFKQAPDVPTIAEAAGLPDFHYNGQVALFGRTGTPRTIIEKLSGTLNKVLADPEVAAKVAPLGIELTPSTPEQLGEIVRADLKKFARAIEASGAKGTRGP